MDLNSLKIVALPVIKANIHTTETGKFNFGAIPDFEKSEKSELSKREHQVNFEVQIIFITVDCLNVCVSNLYLWINYLLRY